MFYRRLVLLTLLLLVFCGCSNDTAAPGRLKTYPVKGTVLVDGQPVESLAVECHNIDGLNKQNPTMSQALTGKLGKFEIGTYQTGDGVPDGEYTLTFLWGDWQAFTMTYGGPDKLNGRYRDPKTSLIKFTVKSGQPTELGEIKLTTE